MRPLKPTFEPAAAEALAWDRYGLRVKASDLPGEIERNFLLETDRGERLVMKIAPQGVKAIDLECQVAVLRHLESSELSGMVQRVVPDREGAGIGTVTTDGDETGHVRVLTYLEGRPLARTGVATPDLRRQIGSIFARLDRALTTFDHPGAHRYMVWDVVRTLELRGVLEHVDDDLRPLVARGLRNFEDRVVPELDGMRSSVIHNDGNDYNLLVCDGGRRLCGLIDFGDMVHTITVADLAIACAYAMLGTSDPLSAAADVVAGYEEAMPLLEVERELLPDLIVARLCASLLMSAQGRLASPDDEYLRISERPVAELLRRLSMPEDSSARQSVQRSPEQVVAVRERHFGPNLSIAYRRPLKIVRGRGQYLFDQDGRQYLDLVNNVCHVGHCHPRVVEAGQRQMAELNTNTRYLHDHLAEYVLRLTATFPDPLTVCFLVCTGTEANDLALRLARAHTGSREIIVLEHAYHGHSPSLVEISTYKCEGPGGEGLATHAHKVPCPDVYRGLHRGGDAAERYSGEVEAAVDEIRQEGRRVGAFMAESLVGCGGQIVPPPGFFESSYATVREAGGVCMADEVQVGFGRVGTHMWAFEAHGVVPDIVTVGKPIGNGHPLAAVITTPEIAASFDTGMEYFNTFGGNPVSCAIGLAVLDVIEEEGLQAHALEMGERFMNGLGALGERHELVGEVRGHGLFLGVELVSDREQRVPAAAEAAEIIEQMKDRGILISTDGPDHNVLKIKPPMVVTAADIDATVAALDEVISKIR